MYSSPFFQPLDMKFAFEIVYFDAELLLLVQLMMYGSFAAELLFWKSKSTTYSLKAGLWFEADHSNGFKDFFL